MRPSATGLTLPLWDEYPERETVEPSAFDSAARGVLAPFAALAARVRPLRLGHPVVVQTQAAAQKLAGKAPAELVQALPAMRLRLRKMFRGRRADPVVVGQAFALIGELSSQHIGQRPFEVQLLAAWANLTGHIAEMRTGEGKSLTAALAAATYALGGVRVHLFTVNDYLARRDHETFLPIFAALGLRAGLVEEGQDPTTRRTAYGCDIVFGTAKQIVFDYLRDGLLAEGADRRRRSWAARLTSRGRKSGDFTMQGLPCAIIDEADSVLLDQACMPFILSEGSANMGGVTVEDLRRAMAVAQEMPATRGYQILARRRMAYITAEGRQWLERHPIAQNGPMRVAAIRDHAVLQALNALHVFSRDRDYLLQDGKVVVIDESTGRPMPDRSWSDGLHQMIELKEGLALTLPVRTIGRITLQTFFRRYQRLCGMTATASPAAAELWNVYGLHVRRIPGRKPDLRLWPQAQIFATSQARWTAVAARVGALRAGGAAILVGTRTVFASEQVSAHLAEQPHLVLNAHSGEREAEIIGAAGQAGCVTVATNMAGRGTDIRISAQTKASGGLHVILTELHESPRLDLQLAGRCGRQGDPGQVELWLSLEDDLIARSDQRLRSLATRLLQAGLPRGCYAVMRLCQLIDDKKQARTRATMLHRERSRDVTLAISGAAE